jgi:hypothetical protein
LGTIPKDIDEAIQAAILLLGDATEDFKTMPDGDSAAGAYHFSLGQYIRNEWGLWLKDPSDLKNQMHGIGVYHPDDMSQVILASAWRTLNDKPLDLENYGPIFKKHWEMFGYDVKEEFK